jgi:hypothetical protein
MPEIILGRGAAVPGGLRNTGVDSKTQVKLTNIIK